MVLLVAAVGVLPMRLLLQKYVLWLAIRILWEPYRVDLLEMCAVGIRALIPGAATVAVQQAAPAEPLPAYFVTKTAPAGCNNSYEHAT